MATTLPTGIVVPDGSDPMNTLVQLLRDMGLTGNRIPSVSSQSEAQAIVDALASTPYPATADNPVYVGRSDAGGVLMRHDGSGWRALTQQTSVISGSRTTTVDQNGAFILPFGVTFADPPIVVCMDGGQGSGAATIGATSTPPTTTQIRLIARKADGTPVANGGAIRCNWLAVGVLA